MKIKSMMGAGALLLTVGIDRALAGFFNIPKPIPEFDGSSSIAVIALLASVAAIIWNRSRNR
jgi:hypothetical protein